ncbi:hypothetical protein KKG24_04610 [Patescibacteria group bacterium]|nr:hypothetical protein [Patescibacteria group bacterium]
MDAMSRYKFCQVMLQSDSTVMLTDRVPYEFEPGLAGTHQHVASQGDTWRSIAHRYWRNSFGRYAGDLWWVIADFQPTAVVDPTIAISAGTVVHVPSPATVLSVFDESRRAEHR